MRVPLLIAAVVTVDARFLRDGALDPEARR
jgi:hypothetical protein